MHVADSDAGSIGRSAACRGSTGPWGPLIRAEISHVLRRFFTRAGAADPAHARVPRSLGLARSRGHPVPLLLLVFIAASSVVGLREPSSARGSRIGGASDRRLMPGHARPPRIARPAPPMKFSPRDQSHSQSHTTTEGAAMSRVRVHNFSISLDGFGTGEGQTLDAPFGHAGHRLHEWMFATRFGRGRPRRVGRHRGCRRRVGRAARTRDRCGDHGRGQVRPSGLAGRPGVARVVGRQPAVPHADVRPDPPSAPVAGDGGRHDVPLPRRRAGGCTRGGAGGSRRSGRPHRRGPDHGARVPRRRSRRPPARRAGADPARPRRSAVGRPGGAGASSTTSRRSRRPAASPTSRSPDEGRVARGPLHDRCR